MFGVDGVPALGAEASEAIERLREKRAHGRWLFRKGERDLGAIGLMDTPRAAARDALMKLRELGITRMIMISGDNQKVAEAIAKDVGLDEAWGDLMPEDKGHRDPKSSPEKTRSLWSATGSTMRPPWPMPRLG